MKRPAAFACAAAVAGAVGGLVYASAWPASQIFGRTLIAGKDTEELALTFDDGPNDAATPQLLDLLAGHGVRATFFLMGSFARLRPQLVRRVAEGGHLIGNHTMDHPRLSLQSQRRVRQQLADCSALLEDLSGQPIRFFRPPFGGRRPVVLQIAAELGLTPVMWNVAGYDWEPLTAEEIAARVRGGMARARHQGRGSNILLHDGGHRGMGADRMNTVGATGLLMRSAAGAQARWITVDAWAQRAG